MTGRTLLVLLAAAVAARAAQQESDVTGEAPFAEFGDRVALFGDHAFVAAPGTPAVHALAFTGGAWVLEGKLAETSPGGSPVEKIGVALAYGVGVTIARNATHQWANVYRRENAAWRLSTQLPLMRVTWATVSLLGDGSRFAVGSPGGAEVYSLSPTVALSASLLPTASNGTTTTAVSMHGDLALLGFSGASGSRGLVVAFRETAPGEWEQYPPLTAPDAGLNDKFGIAVSVYGDRAIIGASFNGEGGIRAGAAYVFELDRDLDEWDWDVRISVNENNARFGFSVGLWGERAIVGAFGDGLGDTGRATVYAYTGGTWIVEASLPTIRDVGDQYGTSVSLWGDRALIGAPGADQNGQSSGMVSVVFLGQYPTYIEEIEASPDTRIRLGEAVVLDGERAMVGAPRVEVTATAPGDDDDDEPVEVEIQVGAVFELNWDDADGWVTESVALPSAAGSAVAGMAFGSSMAMVFPFLVVGAPNDDAGAPLSGSAYAFRKSIGGWEQEARLLPPTPTSLESFGRFIAMSGTRVLVEADRRVYGFSRSDQGSWEFEGILNDEFDSGSTSIAIDGDLAVVADGFYDEPATNVGILHTFQRVPAGPGVNASWVVQDTIVPDSTYYDPAFGQFGHAVALLGDVMAVGVPEATKDKPETGAVFVYGRSEGVWAVEHFLLAADGRTGDAFGFALSLDPERLFVGAPRTDDQGEESGSGYVYHYEAGAWALENKVVAYRRSANWFMGESLAISGDRGIIGAEGSNEGDGLALTYGFYRPAFSIHAVRSVLVPSNVGGALPIQFSVALPSITTAVLDGTVDVDFLEAAFQHVLAVPPVPDMEPHTGTVTLCAIGQTCSDVEVEIGGPVAIGCPLARVVEPGAALVIPAPNIPDLSLIYDLERAWVSLGESTEVPISVNDRQFLLGTISVSVPQYLSYPRVVDAALHLSRRFSEADFVATSPCNLTVTPRPAILQVDPSPSQFDIGQTVSLTVVGANFADLDATRCVLGSIYRVAPRLVTPDGRKMVCDVRWDVPGPILLSVELAPGFESPSSVTIFFVSAPTSIVITQQPVAAISGSQFLDDDRITLQVRLEGRLQTVPTLEPGEEMVASLVGDTGKLEGTKRVTIDTERAQATFTDLVLSGPRNSTQRIKVEALGFSVVTSPVRIRTCAETGVALIVEDPESPDRCACTAGAEALGSSSVDCSLCPLGTFKSTAHSGRCLTCPGPLLTTLEVGADSEDACVCRQGTFIEVLEDGSNECVECPPGVVCMTGAEPAAAPNHYLFNADDGSPVAFACELPEICLGGNNCTEGYQGLLCSECAKSHGSVGEFCVECPPAAANAVLVTFALLAGITMIVVLTSMASRPGSAISVLSKVILNYLQVLSLFSQLSAGWPGAVAGALGIAGLLVPTSQTLSFHCAFRWTVYDRFIAGIALPLCIIAISIALSAFHPGSRSRTAAHAAFLLYLLHPSVVQSTLEVLRCRSYGPAGLRLAGEPSVSCEEGDYESYFAVAILWLLLYCLGLLVAAVGAIWRGVGGNVLLFLRDGYRQDARYWEIFTMARKLLVMLAVTVIRAGSMQLFVGEIILLIAFLANARVEPFESKAVSRIEDASLFALLLTLAAGITFKDPETGRASTAVLAWVVILVNGTFLAAAVTFGLRIVKDSKGLPTWVPMRNLMGGGSSQGTPQGSVRGGEADL